MQSEMQSVERRKRVKFCVFFSRISHRMFINVLICICILSIQTYGTVDIYIPVRLLDYACIKICIMPDVLYRFGKSMYINDNGIKQVSSCLSHTHTPFFLLRFRVMSTYCINIFANTYKPIHEINMHTLTINN